MIMTLGRLMELYQAEQQGKQIMVRELMLGINRSMIMNHLLYILDVTQNIRYLKPDIINLKHGEHRLVHITQIMSVVRADIVLDIYF